MDHHSRSLASLVHHLRQPRGQLRTLENRHGDEPGEFQTLESHHLQQPPHAPPSFAQGAPGAPTRDEVLNYLGRLADDYHLPRKVVYAVAHAESGFNVNLIKENYARSANGHIRHHSDGSPVIKSTDYGLMQVNGSNIYHIDSRGRERGIVKDAQGHPFKIGDDVKTDWRANARAGVALLAPAYHLAVLEQGPGATDEDHAQQAYSQYNSGSPNQRERYLRQRRDGMPAHGADRNFLERYRTTAEHKK